VRTLELLEQFLDFPVIGLQQGDRVGIALFGHGNSP
jgi:hypothetical protein